MSASLIESLRSYSIGREESVLKHISNEETVIAVWQRPPMEQLLPAISALLSSQNPVRWDFRTSESSSFMRALTAQISQESTPAVLASWEELFGDIQRLAEKFTAISGRKHLRLRLERVEDDGCALFHVDTLSMRMLCTYAGPGTQWLKEDNVRREELGLRGRLLEEANAAIVVDPEKIQTEPAWNVLIFKGRLWQGYGYSDGLVHRSAPVRHPGDHRLRLTIDFSDECDC